MRSCRFSLSERRDEGKAVMAWLALKVAGSVVQVPGTEGEMPSVTTFSFTMTGPKGMALQRFLEDLTSTCMCTKGIEAKATN